MRKKRILGTILVIVGVIVLMLCLYSLYHKNNYPVEMYQAPIEIEYDFTKSGLSLDDVQEMNDNQALIEYREDTKKVYSIEGVISKEKIYSLEDALSILYDYREVFEVRGYEYIGRVIEVDNQNKYILYQLHEGIRVEGYSFTIETTKEGDGIKIIGRYLDVSSIRTDSFLSYKECLEINRKYFKGSQIEEARLVICKFEDNAELCWRYEIFSKGSSPHLIVHVSAVTGDIVWISGEAIS